MDPQAAFRQVYQAHSDALYGYFLSRTSEREAAADLTQDLFLRAWRHLPELLSRNDDGQRAWLFTVARNLAIDASRRRGTRDRVTEALRAEPDRPVPAADGSLLSAERVAEVGRAVAALPDDLRAVLTLAATSDLTSAQIGAALGVPAGTARYRLSRARAAVAAAVAEIDAPDADPDGPGRNGRGPEGRGRDGPSRDGHGRAGHSRAGPGRRTSPADQRRDSW